MSRVHKIMDDILSETAAKKDAVKNYKAVLIILEKHDVKAKLSKFNFGSKVPYDGIWLIEKGMLRKL